MELRLLQNQIHSYAELYACPREETELLDLRGAVAAAGRLTIEQLRLLARWKSPRSAGRIGYNADSFVQEITAFALKVTDERARIEALTLLNGVLWPTASVILHIFHADRYPILDYRALYSVSTDVPTQYSFEFWWKYVVFCRTVAEEAKVSMRVLDRALWQYSKINQLKKSEA